MAWSARRAGVLGLFDRVFGDRSRIINPALFALLAALVLSLCGVYAIDLGSGMNPDVSGPLSLSDRAFKQLVFVGVGMVAALVIAFPDYRRIR
ncbi:MAG TPA: hypothetical protein VK509_25840, partial [Polyangiales bacterium]|nr:hypothetical protein [Polyangiales bacterium]